MKLKSRWSRWNVGDRAAYEHPMSRGRRHGQHVDHGTVTAMDEPGLPTGVRLTFDEPCPLGPTSCYALPIELYRSPKVTAVDGEA